MRLITFQAPYQTSTVAEAKLGEEAVTPDGRAWKYIQATHTASVAGGLVVPDASSVYQGTLAAGTLTATANSTGQVVYLTYSTGGLTAGALEDGWLYFYIGTGEGLLVKVKTNSATVIELYPNYALAATTTIDGTSGAKFWNPCSCTPSLVTTQTQIVTGVAQTAFAINAYGWVLIRGYGTVLGSSFTAGAGVGPGGATAGFGLVATTAKGPFDQFYVGSTVIVANDSSKQNMVFVNCG